MTLDSDLFMQALHCQNTSRPPVWLMRQAGRHLAAYRTLREKYSFLELCHHPDLIAEVTLLPIHTYDLDAAILFSDILVIPEALGLGLRFEDRIGPILDKPIRSVREIEQLPNPDLTSLDFVKQGIHRIKSLTNKPLIGFCGAPFTVASYMIEGGSSRDFKKTKKWMFEDPASFHLLLTKIADWSIAYLQMQIDSGVNAVQIFDSWANTLAYAQFQEFSLAYHQYILEGIKRPQTPVILFCRGSSVFAPALAKIKPKGIGIDWNCNLKEMREKIGYPIALQGNLDPDILYAPLRQIEKEVTRLLDDMQGDKGFILNLGHGVAPDVTEDAVRTLVECVKRGSA
jgi:uroporphyrinogen decarboxylase